MNRYFIFFLALIIYSYSYSQSFYVISQRDLPPANKTFLLNINNCDSAQLYTCPPTNNTNQIGENQFTDIAISFTASYYVSGWGSLYRKNISDSVSCEYLGNFNYNINALAINNAGVIYATGQLNNTCKLFKYQAGTFTSLGNFPPGFISAGDLFFFENRLFMTGTNSNLTSGSIIEVDVNNPSQSCYYMALPNMKPWGAFSMNIGNNSRVFIISANDNMGNHTSSLYEINMELKTMGSVICTYPYFIHGAATVYSFSNVGNTLCDPSSINTFAASGHFFRAYISDHQTINIESNIDPSMIENIILIGASGIVTKPIDPNYLNNKTNISDMPPGLYLLNLKTKKGELFQQKLLK